MKPFLCAALLLFIQPAIAQYRDNVESTVQVLDIASGGISTVYKGKRHLEAPNWAPSGVCLLLNSRGKLYTLRWPEGQNMTLANALLCPIATGNAKDVNNDHGFSPEGDYLAISHYIPDSAGVKGYSVISVIPSCGGTPRRVVSGGPSYWHGWSPDGQTLAYCGERNGNFDVYTVPANGGAETRLTSGPGLDDGPEFSPDGQYIYFNTYRDSTMQIWRMRPDGSGKEPVLADGYDNWFAHLSPDGSQFVVISYLERQHGEHPFGKQVKLRLYNLQEHTVRDLTPAFFGGQGTMNVPSWSPNGKMIAFVKYRVLE